MFIYSNISKSNSTSNLPEVYKIDVLYEAPFDVSIFAAKSEINPILLPKGKIDEQALADYDAFIDNLYECLAYYFDIVELEESPKSKTSWYFYLYAKNAKGEITTKFIVRLRVSDHVYPEYHSTEAEKTFVENRVQEFKRPNNKKYQRWKIYNIIVNGDKYENYDDALDDIEDKMAKLSRKLGKTK